MMFCGGINGINNSRFHRLYRTVLDWGKTYIDFAIKRGHHEFHHFEAVILNNSSRLIFCIIIHTGHTANKWPTNLTRRVNMEKIQTYRK